MTGIEQEEEGKFYTIQTSRRLEKIPYKEFLFIERESSFAIQQSGKGTLLV